MSQRIISLIIAIAFFVTTVGVVGLVVYQHIANKPEAPKTTAEINQERLAQLQDNDYGFLADFTGRDTPLTEPEIEEVKIGEGDLAATTSDIITFTLKYALATDGKIFPRFDLGADYLQDQSQTAGIEALPANFQAIFLGMKPGGQRRIFVPNQLATKYGLEGERLPTDQDLVIDAQLVGIADRAEVDFESQTGLTDFVPLTQALTELEIEDLFEGQGAAIVSGDEVSLGYIGVKATTGEKFDASNVATFSLEGVIEGFREGLIGLKEGGRRRIFIPASQAYDSGDLANLDLIFDVELISITRE